MPVVIGHLTHECRSSLTSWVAIRTMPIQTEYGFIEVIIEMAVEEHLVIYDSLPNVELSSE